MAISRYGLHRMSASKNKRTMEEVFSSLAEGERSPFAAAMADDFTWTIAGVATQWAGTWHGRQAVREHLFAPLFAQFADRYTNTAISFTAEEDRVVVECRGKVTTKGGARYDNQYCYVCRFHENGKLAALVEYADTALMEAALAPPPQDPPNR